MASALLNRVKGALFKGVDGVELSGGAVSRAAQLGTSLLTAQGKWRTVHFAVDAEWRASRLDRLLTGKFDISASLAQKLIRTRKVWVERPDARTAGSVGAIRRIPARSGLRLVEGDSVNFSDTFLPPRKTPVPLSAAEDAQLTEWTLFEDRDMLVLNKPSGLAVHPGPKIDVSMHQLLQGRDTNHRIVHRLDRGTSGVLVVAKNRHTAESLHATFAGLKGLERDAARETARNVAKDATTHDSATITLPATKRYLAVLIGIPEQHRGEIKTMIYRANRKRLGSHDTEEFMTTCRTKRAELLDEGKVAITRYAVRSVHTAKINGARRKLSLVEFVPQTGRTHQLRVHAAEQLGCPIVGDIKYGITAAKNMSRVTRIGHGIHLHCQSIAITPQRTFSAPIPPHFVKTLLRFPLYIKPPRPGTKTK